MGTAPTALQEDPGAGLPLLEGALDGEADGGALVVTHGGAGTPASDSDGAERAAEEALALLRSGAGALEAAIAGTVVLEDDPRFNAGTGSTIRLDGATIQMDASLMSDDGRFAAVAAIERVRNPIRAAALVLRSPHLLLAGEGATRFAHRMGLPEESPECGEARARHQRRMERLSALGGAEPLVARLRAGWNYPVGMPAALLDRDEHGDTVGSVARDAQGRFAATLSTGGTSLTLYGRVGDVPVPGAGLYAGPAGAVACTGDGEEIIRLGLARSVYEALAGGVEARRAVARAAASFPAGHSVGLIAVDARGWGAAANTSMAFAHAPRQTP